MELSFDHFNYKTKLDQQRDLFKECFPETTGEAIQSKEYYLWKFQSFPYVPNSWEFAAFMDQEIVGYYAFIPYRYKIGREFTPVGMACDVMSSSKYRRIGVFSNLARYSMKELSAHVPFIMGYPIRNGVAAGHQKVGYRIAFKMPLYIKFIKSNSLLKSKKLGFFIPFINMVLPLYNGIVKSRVNNKYTCSIFSNIDLVDNYEPFVLEWSNSVENCLIKDKSFVRWRYSAPGKNYKFLTVSDNGKMIGFVAFRKFIRENVPSFGILDYMVLPGYSDCHGLINQVLVDCAAKEKVEALLIMMSRYSANNYKLCRNGYLKSPFTFHLIINNLTNKYQDEDLLKEKNWHIMWVDSDDL